MPRKERIKESKNKQYKEAAKAKGQTKINSSFFRRPAASEQSRQEIETDAHTSTQSTNIGGNINICIEETEEQNEEEWIKLSEEFTSKDKALSEKNGRYFLVEWMKIYPWLMYSREKKISFLQYLFQLFGKEINWKNCV